MANAGKNGSYCSDEEQLLGEVTSSSEVQQPHSKDDRRRAVHYTLGAIALVACAAVAFVAVAPSKAGGYMTAMQLFESPRVHEVATRNLMTIGEHLVGKGNMGPTGPVRRLVEQGFQNATLHLRNVHPEAVHAFENIPITKEHEDAIAHVMGYLADDRVSNLGVKIAHAVRDAKSDDPEVLKRHIAQALFHHMDVMLSLKREMYPKDSPLRSIVDEADSAEMPDAETIRKLASVSDGWKKIYPDDEDTVVDQDQRKLLSPRNLQSAYAVAGGGGGGGSHFENPFGTDAGTAENVVGMAGAVMEEAGTLLRIMRPLAKMVGTDLNVPPDVTTGIGAADLAMEFGTCEIDAIADKFNPMEFAACPVEFGSQAMDVLRSPLAYLGVLGDNNPANGVQGNHNGANKHNASLGMLDDWGWMDQSDIDDLDLFNSN